MTIRALSYQGKGNTFIRVRLLHKARKGNYKKDLIEFEIKSKTVHIAGAMTVEEAILLSNGLINAITIKLHKEKKI